MKNSFIVRSKSSKIQCFPIFSPKEEKYVFSELENEVPITILDEESNSLPGIKDSKNLGKNSLG